MEMFSESMKRGRKVRRRWNWWKIYKGKGKQNQLVLQESFDRTTPFDINHPRAQRIHQRIGEMIAVDSQSFLIVEDDGFSRLLKTLEPRYSLPSRRFFTENILPRIHAGVKSEVQNLISNVPCFSFTTDIRSTCVSNDSLFSLTAQTLLRKSMLSYTLRLLMKLIQERISVPNSMEC